MQLLHVKQLYAHLRGDPHIFRRLGQVLVEKERHPFPGHNRRIDQFQVFKRLNRQFHLYRQYIRRRQVGNIGGRGDDRPRTDRYSDFFRQFVRAADMACQQADRMNPGIIHHNDCRIGTLVLHMRRHYPDNDACRHDEDQSVILVENRSYQFAQVFERDGFFRQSASGPGVKVYRHCHGLAQPLAEQSAFECYREYGNFHGLASRNIWPNSGA